MQKESPRFENPGIFFPASCSHPCNKLRGLFAGNKKEKGQALVTLVAFIAFAVIVIGGAVVLSVITSKGAVSFWQGEKAMRIAEGGVENAILRLIRDPTYTGETLDIDGETVTITVTGTTTKTIVSTVTMGNFVRSVQIQGTLNRGAFTISDWEEIN